VYYAISTKEASLTISSAPPIYLHWRNSSKRKKICTGRKRWSDGTKRAKRRKRREGRERHKKSQRQWWKKEGVSSAQRLSKRTPRSPFSPAAARHTCYTRSATRNFFILINVKTALPLAPSAAKQSKLSWSSSHCWCLRKLLILTRSSSPTRSPPWMHLVRPLQTWAIRQLHCL